MTALSAGMVEAIVQSYDFSGMGVLMDVGGGEGVLIAAILAANPTLHDVLFDQPHVLTGAKDLLERQSVEVVASPLAAASSRRCPRELLPTCSRA
jgi:hypothetical protein